MSNRNAPTTRTVEVAFRGLKRVAVLGVILIPLTYLPVLYVLDGQGGLFVLIALIVVNVCCLLVDQRV